jgi:hypothetical protein
MSLPRLIDAFLAAIIAAIAGLIIGGLVAIISRELYLICIFPIVIVVVATTIMFQAFRTGRVKNASVRVAIGILMALMIIGSYRGVKYALFRREIEQGVSAQKVDAVLKSETGQTGILGYYIYLAQERSTLRYKGAGLGISGPVVWIYWLAEAAAILLILPGVAYNFDQVYCDEHDKPFKEILVGFVPTAATTNFVGMVKASNFKSASQMIARIDKAQGYPHLQINIEKCPVCETDPVLKATYRPNQKDKEVQINQRISADDYWLIAGTAS